MSDMLPRIRAAPTFRIMRLSAFAVALTLLPAVAQAQPPERPAWEWTTEERLAVRTDAEAARARVDKSERRQRRAAQATRPVDTITGNDNPELFLPHQVFETLVDLAFMHEARHGEMVQEGFTPDVKRHGLPADFWVRLRTVTTIYVADMRELHAVQQRNRGVRTEAQESFAQAYDTMCRSRADALAAARHEFGRERFDRFLYEVIVKGMFSTAWSPVNGDLLRRAEEGCR